MKILLLTILVVLFPSFMSGQNEGEISESRLIYDFEDGQIPIDIQFIDSRCEIEDRCGNHVLSAETGLEKQVAGITFDAVDNDLWDFSEFARLAVDVINYSDEPVTIWAGIRGFSKSAPEKLIDCLVPGATTLKSGTKGVLNVNIYASGKRLSTEKEIFAGRGIPLGSGDLDPSRIKQIKIYVEKSVREWKFGIDNIRLEDGVEVIATNMFFPFIDSLGQYKHSSWPGKTGSSHELKANAIAEKNELANFTLSQDFNEFGGWKIGGNFEATGYFYTKKLDNKWWLIDPVGNLFFSHGVNGVGNTAPTPIDLRENYFENLPDKSGEFSECWGTSNWAPHGFYKDHTPYNTFDFLKANLIKKYGKSWKKQYREITHMRFRAWGINTLGNWSQNFMYDTDSKTKIPYVVSGSSGNAKPIEGSSGWWRKFPDPFDRSFRESIRASLKGFTNSAANDPYCLGFFVDNEQSWGDEITLSLSTLRSPGTQAAKIVFVSGLKSKYGTIENLNSSWKSVFNSWDELLDSVAIPDEHIEEVRNDLVAFYTKLAKEYFRISREEVKRIAPDQMYLGCRFSAEMMENDVLQFLSQEYCDVITYNIYNLLPVGFTDKIDKPVIIGEFHFGALDRGMFHTGLWFAKDQAERAELYENFMLYSLAHPLIVGTHWFQYPAQPSTGRGDGENFQIGFSDICDKPYTELVEAIRTTGSTMYQIRRDSD